MNIGIVGLGLLGLNISIRLLNTKKYKINVFNRTKSKIKSLASYKIKSYDSPKDLANNSDFIIICVTDFDALKDVCFDKNGIISTNNANLIIGDFSTITPNQSRFCAKKFQNKQISMLNIPVMGGPKAALSGDLIPIISGNKNSFLKIKPVLKHIGKSIFYVGNNIGDANAIKLALNLNIGLIASGLSEGIILSQSYNIDPSLYLKILNSTYFKTGMSENKGPKMIKDDFSPSFYLKNMFKDLDLAMNAAKESNISLPVTTQVRQLYQFAVKQNMSDLDYTGILKLIQYLNGLK
ncbi:MAG: NAD(P)-dependent oxidoreductase [Nitrososphaeraceae archaeon]